MMLLLQGSPPVEYHTLYEGQQTEVAAWLVTACLINKPATESWRALWAQHRGTQPWIMR